jgi:hypothetical protein
MVILRWRTVMVKALGMVRTALVSPAVEKQGFPRATLHHRLDGTGERATDYFFPGSGPRGHTRSADSEVSSHAASPTTPGGPCFGLMNRILSPHEIVGDCVHRIQSPA